MLNRPLLLVAALLFILTLVWFQQRQSVTEVARTALIMGTLVEIKGVGSEQQKLETAISDAFAVMREEEERFSPSISSSQLAVLNRATKAIAVDDQTLNLLQRGLEISRQSQRAFSLGLGGIKKLWNFSATQPQASSLTEIEQVLPDPTLDPFSIEGHQVKRRPGVQLDLGGIAKGYAVDQALQVLRKAGVRSASVNAGGDIGLLGGHGKRSWKIGIQHPRKPGELLATIELRDRSIVTSGDYERFFVVDGVRYHHIFDPQTGLPARGCQSVSVIAANTAEADALATAAFVLGPEKGLQLLEQWPGVDGLIVAADGSSQTTSGIKDLIQWR